MRKPRVSSHPGSRTCGAITWCRPMLFMSSSARPAELPTALLFRRRAARASACWSSTATTARPRRTPGNWCPDSFPRRSVSARYAIDTGGQPDRAIRAAHRFVGTTLNRVRAGTSLALATSASWAVVQAARVLKPRLAAFGKSGLPASRAAGIAAAARRRPW